MKYQLHDFKIDAIIFENDEIIFSFPDGFYAEDDDGNEIVPRRHKLAFKIQRTDPDETLESFLFISQANRCLNGWKDISFKRFASYFKKGPMIIYDEYDSKLTNWKMIQLNANTKRSNIELFITDIIDIACYE